MATERTSVLTIGEHAYYIPQSPLTRLSPQRLRYLEDFEQTYIPATAINCDKEDFSDNDIKTICQTFAEQDDVWTSSFLPLTLLLQPPHLRRYSKDGTTTILAIDNSKAKLPQGPLVVNRSTGEIYAIYRLYQDTHHAFFESTLLKHVISGKLQSHAQVGEDKSHIVLPVPSRLYSPPPCTEKPLSGLRFAVKDTIELKGFKTGYGSAHYRATYPPAKAHAPCVQILLDKGAVMVGIAKTTEFAEGTDPHEWIESECPYNPRGDGQQKPSSSSTGSAVAAAAYEWLDFSLGTDTGGSIRHPAGVNGLFGSRTTQGAIDLTGVLGATDLLNTVGVFARDATTFGDVGRQLLPTRYQPAVPFSGRKYKLLYPIRAPMADSPDPLRWFPNPSDNLDLSDAEKHMETFVERLEAHLDCERVCFNIDELWQATRPKGQPETLDEAVGNIYSTLTAYFAVNTCVDQFCLDYATKNEGLQPFITTVVKDRQEHGRNLPASQVAAAINSMRAFAEWVETVLYGAYDEEAIALMVFPQSFGLPNYRHDIVERKELFKDGFSIYAFGYLVGCPDYTIPVGEIPFLSDVSERIEQLPVSVSMVARPGNDIPLFDILSSLEEKGGLSAVKAGVRMYE